MCIAPVILILVMPVVVVVVVVVVDLVLVIAVAGNRMVSVLMCCDVVRPTTTQYIGQAVDHNKMSVCVLVYVMICCMCVWDVDS